MAASVEEVAALPDPVGDVIESFHRPNGLRIEKVRVPLGVIAIVYESRPNVTMMRECSPSRVAARWCCGAEKKRSRPTPSLRRCWLDLSKTRESILRW